MSKKPKQKQTEWNIQGKQIADTAVPLYQTNLGDISNFNTQDRMDSYINKYFDNTAEQSDFIRNFNRAMSNATAQNYAATGGGYDTSNQRMYDDQQRYMNDWAARLREKGVTLGNSMANQDYQNLLTANVAYRNAYALGQPYSDVDQYNYQVKQSNKWYNQLGGLLGAGGAVVGNMIAPGVGGYIGGSLGGALGDALTVQAPGEGQSGAQQWANITTNALANYYGQQQQNKLGSNQAIRGGESFSYTPGQQYLNPSQETSNFLTGNNPAMFNGNLSQYFQDRLRKQGINNG